MAPARPMRRRQNHICVAVEAETFEQFVPYEVFHRQKAVFSAGSESRLCFGRRS